MLTTSALQSPVFPTNKLESWNIFVYFNTFFYIRLLVLWSSTAGLVVAVVPLALMFARDLTVIWLGRLISNLIIPLINVWCLGALAGVRVTSVRLPETVKQTPAKPESRSQAKTLPVSSGLWTQDVHSRDLPELWSRFYWQIFFQQGKSEKSKCSF